MSTSYIQALAGTWAQLAKEMGFPADYDSTSAPETHRACGVVQEQIRECIVTTNDMCLFGLLRPLGQASLRIKQALWPDDYARMICEVAEALRKVEYPNSKSYTQEEVMQAMQERINQRLGKSA